jgi:hypothetical protein
MALYSNNWYFYEATHGTPPVVKRHNFMVNFASIGILLGQVTSRGLEGPQGPQGPRKVAGNRRRPREAAGGCGRLWGFLRGRGGLRRASVFLRRQSLLLVNLHWQDRSFDLCNVGVRPSGFFVEELEGCVQGQRGVGLPWIERRQFDAPLQFPL